MSNRPLLPTAIVAVTIALLIGYFQGKSFAAPVALTQGTGETRQQVVDCSDNTNMAPPPPSWNQMHPRRELSLEEARAEHQLQLPRLVPKGMVMAPRVVYQGLTTNAEAWTVRWLDGEGASGMLLMEYTGPRIDSKPLLDHGQSVIEWSAGESHFLMAGNVTKEALADSACTIPTYPCETTE